MSFHAVCSTILSSTLRFAALLLAGVAPSFLLAGESPAFSRPNAGFAGLFEERRGPSLALNSSGKTFVGQYVPEDGKVWKVVAGPGSGPDVLVGEITLGATTLNFKASWDGDDLIVDAIGRPHRLSRTAQLIPALADLGESPGTLIVKRNWTIAVYMGADNDLEGEALDDLKEMTDGMPEKDVEVIVLCDRAKGYADGDGDWTGARLLRLRPGQKPEVLKELGELDMSNASTLGSFLTGVYKKYPSRNTAAWLWDHGGGWHGVVLDEDIPGRPGQKGMLDIVDIRMGLRTALVKSDCGPIDLIAFDACNMAQLEVAIQICDLGRYMTASEQVVPGEGYPYRKVFPLFAAERATPREIAIGISEAYAADYSEKQNEGTTMAAIDLSHIPAVASELHSFSFLAEVFKESYWPAIKRALYYGENYGARHERLLDTSNPSIDLRDFIDRLMSGPKPLPVGPWINGLRKALDRAVLSSRNGDSRSRSHGLAIFAPRTSGQKKPAYSIFSPLAHENDWLMLLESVHAEAEKHSKEPVTFSKLEFSSLSLKKPVVKPFNGDVLRFTLTGNSLVQVTQVDMVREDDSWIILRKRWVPDPAWMARVREGATDLADLFMPNFNDGENRLAVELTGQRFLVSNGRESVNLTLDASDPDHGAPLVASGKLLRQGETTALEVEIAFDPVMWTAVLVLPVSKDPNIAGRAITPGPEDKISFVIETLDDKGVLGKIETAEMDWMRGPALLFAADEPGKYRTLLSAETMDGRIAETSAYYDIEANPDLDDWAAAFAGFDLSQFKIGTSWPRSIVGPGGALIPTGAVTTLMENVGGVPGFFKVETKLTINGKPEAMTEYWFFHADPVPTLRVFQRIAGAPDLCWSGPVSLGTDGNQKWIAMKVMQMGGVLWKWNLSILDSLRIDEIVPATPKKP